MKIAIATKHYDTVSGHAGQARHWLLYDLAAYRPGQVPPEPLRVELEKAQFFHHFQDDAPHPLDGVDLAVVASAGEGFVRHLKQRGTDVLVTGEADPRLALQKILAGEALAQPRFDITTSLCKLRDLFSRH